MDAENQNFSTAVCRVITVSPIHNQGQDNLQERKPCARSGHAAVANNRDLYMFGGYNPNYRDASEHLDPLFQEMWKYNFDDQSWELIQDRGTVPIQLASMSMVRCGNIIVLYGGTGFPFGFQKSSSLFCFNIKDNRWRVMSGSKQVPESMYGQAIAVQGSNLFVFGGTSGWDYTANVHKTDLRTGVWEKCFDYERHLTKLVMKRVHKDDPDEFEEPEVPYPRYRHEMLSDEENLYVIGGGTSNHAFPLDAVHVFNIKLYKWKRRMTIADPEHGFPGRRRCHGCCQLGNNGYITGGFNGRRIYDDVWKLNIKTLEWTKLKTKLPEPVYFHASAITPDGCLYYHGGVLTHNGTTRTDKLNFIWVSVPSLVTIAWRNILKINPSVRKLSNEALQSLGIPLHIVKR